MTAPDEQTSFSEQPRMVPKPVQDELSELKAEMERIQVNKEALFSGKFIKQYKFNIFMRHNPGMLVISSLRVKWFILRLCMHVILHISRNCLLVKDVSRAKMAAISLSYKSQKNSYHGQLLYSCSYYP